MFEVQNHPNLKQRGMLIDHFDFSKWNVDKASIPGPLIKFSETKGSVNAPGPEFRQYNEDVFGNLLGYPKKQLKVWKKEQVIWNIHPKFYKMNLVDE